MALVPVLVYPTLSQRDELLDGLVHGHARRCETPLSAAPNWAYDLFGTAGVKHTDWVVHLLEKHGVSLVNPDRDSIRSAYPNLAPGYVEYDFRRMEANAGNWGRDLESFERNCYALEEGQKATVTCEAMEEILGGSLGEGLVALHFMADADELREALAADNEITVSPDPQTDGGVLFGLYDPANGAGAMEQATGPITFRPSLVGKVVVGTEEILELFGMDGGSQPKARLEAVRGGPVMVSSRGEMRDDFGVPEVDLSALDGVGSNRRP